jgi:hypothetical protein
MSTMELLGLFVLVPLAAFAVIALLVYAPSWVRGPKYRPGLQWWAEPVWIGGEAIDTVTTIAPVTEGGGCSARW